MAVISLRSHLFDSRDPDNQKLDLLIRPSWFSGVGVMVASLAVVIGSIAALHYHGSQFQFWVQLEAANSHAVSANTQTVQTNLTANTLIADIPLFVFWAGIGLIAYSFTMAVIDSLRRVEDLREEVNYVHADRRGLLVAAAERVLLRLVVLLAWFLYIRFTAHVVLPYVIAVAYAATGPVGLPAAIGFALWGIALSAACLHLHVILARLLALRPRLFGQTA